MKLAMNRFRVTFADGDTVQAVGSNEADAAATACLATDRRAEDVEQVYVMPETSLERGTRIHREMEMLVGSNPLGKTIHRRDEIFAELNAVLGLMAFVVWFSTPPVCRGCGADYAADVVDIYEWIDDHPGYWLLMPKVAWCIGCLDDDVNKDAGLVIVPHGVELELRPVERLSGPHG